MANVTYVAGRNITGQGIAGLLRRFAAAIEIDIAGLRKELEAARHELCLRRALRGIDRRQLRDIGLDRGAC